MANKVYVGADGNWSTSASWSPSGVPAFPDNVRIPAGAGNITLGLDQSAVWLGNITVESGYSQPIGNATNYLQVRANGTFEYSGTGLAYIDLGNSPLTAANIYSSARAASGYRGLYLKASAITTLNVTDGQVGVAAQAFETSTITTIRAVGKNASVWTGAGCTLTTFSQIEGDSILNCAATTVNVYGGTVRTRGVGAIGTLMVERGTVYPESSGTITTLNAHGGTVDFLGSGAARTLTNLNQNPGSTVKYDPASLTITNRNAPDAPIVINSSLP
jgi:hypothetical protein